MSVRPSSQDAISVSQAAELTGASSKSLRRRIERGTLGSIRQGGRRLIPVSELIRVGLLDESGQAQTAAPAFATAAGAGGTLRSPSTQDAAAAAWAAAAPGPPAPAGAAPRRSVPASPVQARPAPATSPPPAAAGRPAQSPVPASRSQASPPQVRAPWSDEPRRPSAPVPQGYPRQVADQAPARAPAAPTASAPPQPAAPASPTRGDGLTPQESRRLAAMVELVMHQMRTINALNARLSRLEARLDDLSGSGR